MKNYNDLYSNDNNKKNLNIFSLNPNNQTYSHNKTTLYDALQSNILIAVLLFLLGFIGPSLVQLVLQEILENSSFSKIMLEFLCIFIPYIVTFTVMLTVILSIPFLRKNLIHHQFSQKSYLFLFTFLCLIIFYLGNIFISVVTSYFTPNSNNNQDAIEGYIYFSPLLSTIMTVIFAPLVEEITYRASIFAFFGHKHKYAALVVSSIFFAFIHFDFTTIGTSECANEIINIFSYLFAGFFFGYTYLRSESILSNMTLHAINNLIASLLIISTL